MILPCARPARRIALLALAGLSLLGPGRAAAEPPRLALVIGVDRDTGSPGEGVCGPAASWVRDRLGEQGFAVQATLNPSEMAMRSAIDGFAMRIEASPPASALIYACGIAIPVADRLFLMPSGAGSGGRADPIRQGVVLQVLLKVLAETGGTLYADLDSPSPAAAGTAAEQAGKRLPAGPHLALSLTEHNGAARIGERLASSSFQAGQGWDAASAAIQAGPAPDGTTRLFLMPPAGSVPAAGPAQDANGRVSPEPGDATPPAGATAPPGPPGGASPPDAGPDASTQPETAEAQPGASARVPLRGNGAHAPGRVGGAVRTNGELPGNRIKRLQTALARNGYAGPIDGRLNGAAVEAIRHFQRSLGHPETGALTQAELVALLNQ